MTPDLPDGFLHDLALLHGPQDAAAARVLDQALRAHGLDLAWAPGQMPLGGLLDDRLAGSRWVLVLWSADSRGDAGLRERAAQARSRHALLPLRLDVTGHEPDQMTPEVSLVGWSGQPTDPILLQRVGQLLSLLRPDALPTDEPANAPAEGWRDRLLRSWKRWRGGDEPMPPPPPLRAPGPVGTDAALERTVPLNRPRPPAEAGPPWLAASAPGHVAAGQLFTARLGVAVPALAHVLQAAVSDLDDLPRRAEGLPPAQGPWRPGAPLTVLLDGGPDLLVSPARRHLNWSGRAELASFSVAVARGIPDGPRRLHFQLLLAGVPMAGLTLTLRVEPPNVATALAVPRAEAPQRLPRRLWLASVDADRAALARRLEAARHWAPGLDWVRGADAPADGPVEGDALLLCWSRAAADDPGVVRALQQAWSAEPPLPVLPLPLHDPEALPPPPGSGEPWLERLHSLWPELDEDPDDEPPTVR